MEVINRPNIHSAIEAVQGMLEKNEIERKEVVEDVRKVVSERFTKLQELKEKVRIENEKQRLLMGVLDKLKNQSVHGEEEADERFLKKQIEILSQYLKVKKEEFVLKKAILNEKNSQVQQLEEKLNVYQEGISTLQPDTSLVPPKPILKKETQKSAGFQGRPQKKQKIPDPDDFFSELLQ